MLLHGLASRLAVEGLKLSALVTGAFELRIGRHDQMAAAGTHVAVCATLSNHGFETIPFRAIWTSDGGHDECLECNLSR